MPDVCDRYHSAQGTGVSCTFDKKRKGNVGQDMIRLSELSKSTTFNF